MVIKEGFENSSIEVLHRDKERIDSVVTIKATPRVEKLRNMYLERRYSVSIDKMRIETSVMKETEGESMEIRRAKVFSAYVRELPISIFSDELIVGCAGINPRCRYIDPEELEGIEAGVEVDRYLKIYNKSLSDEDRKIMKKELIPYWKGDGDWAKTRHGRNYQLIPPEIFNLMVVDPEEIPPKMSFIYTPGRGLTEGGHIGHNSIGYNKVLKKGFLGVKRDAEERLARINRTSPEEVKKVPFLEGVIMAMEAAAEIGKRFAARAREMAESEEDTKRKAELLKIAEVCDWVPAKPARSFREALQSVYFARMLVMWETSHCVSHSVGRIEQFLNHYYEKDTKEGKLTQEETQELLDCFLIKLSHSGHGDHVGVGGVKSNGQDATNDLSYMILEGMAHVRLVEPFVSVMVHSKTPDLLLIKAYQLLSLGTGHPVFINNDVQVEQMLARAIPLEHARTVSQVGCYEPVIAGYDAGDLPGGFMNLASIMELVMSNGWNHYYQKKLGLETGDPRQFKSFEELREAFRSQVAWLVKDIMLVEKIVEQTLVELCPTPYESALIEDCIEKGMSREAGGARYNFAPMVIGTGAVDAGNSLASIKKLVFEKEKITMDQLCNALDKNFAGYDNLRQLLLKEPKFGNDDDYVDEQVAWVSHVFADEVKKFTNPRGGYGTIIGAPMQNYVYAGSVTGALPSGRLAGQPLSDAWSPCAGTDLNGPTSVFKSHGKIDHVELLCGVTLNMRLDPAIFKGEDGIKRCMDMIRTFVDQKIFQVQINVISSETLRAAQNEPHKYRDVIVKVAGYSDYFVTLPKALQDGIIARTEHKL
jgi:formate C-acetyltransferase